MHYCVIAKLWMSHDRRGYDATGQYQSNNRRHKLSMGDIPSHGFCETLRHEETFIVGVKKFTPEAERVLAQFGDVEVVHLDGDGHSLVCSKARVMLCAKTSFVTWADSDAFFTGNVSSILPPVDADKLHFRLRTPSEMPAVFMGHKFGEEATRIPKFVLDVWRRDVADVAGEARDATLYETSGSFDEYVSVVEWTVSQGLTLPGQTPGCLVRSRKGLMRALIPWMTLKPKIPIRLKRIFWPPQHEDAVVCAVVLSATHYERIV